MEDNAFILTNVLKFSPPGQDMKAVPRAFFYCASVLLCGSKIFILCLATVETMRLSIKLLSSQRSASLINQIAEHETVQE